MSKNSMEHSSDDADDDDDQEVLFVSATLLESSLLDESTPAEPPRSEPLVQCMWPRGMLLVYCMVGFIGSIAEGGLIVWTPEFFEDNLGATTLTKQFGLAAFMLGEFITRWRMVDYLRQRYGRRRVVMTGGALAAVSCFSGVAAVLAPQAFRVPLATVSFFFFGVGTAPLIPIAFSSGGHFAENTQAALGAVAFCTDSGSVVGPFLVGGASTLLGGVPFALLVAAGIIALAVPVAFGLPDDPEVYQKKYDAVECISSVSFKNSPGFTKTGPRGISEECRYAVLPS
jgi:MFS family permease